MADERQRDEERGDFPSTFREDRERYGNATHGAHTIEDSINDRSMSPEPVQVPEGTGSAVVSTVGAVAGAVAGAAVGVLGGPAGIAAGGAAGAAIGAGAGSGAGNWADKQDDETLEDKRMKEPAADYDQVSPQERIGADPESSIRKQGD